MQYLSLVKKHLCLPPWFTNVWYEWCKSRTVPWFHFPGSLSPAHPVHHRCCPFCTTPSGAGACSFSAHQVTSTTAAALLIVYQTYCASRMVLEDSWGISRLKVACTHCLSPTFARIALRAPSASCPYQLSALKRKKREWEKMFQWAQKLSTVFPLKETQIDSWNSKLIVETLSPRPKKCIRI